MKNELIPFFYLKRTKNRYARFGKYLLFLLFLFGFIVAPTSSFSKNKHIKENDAQEVADIAVKGQVTNNDGIPIIGASIQVKGTTRGTITDNEGKFSLEVPEGSTLQISSIGYETKEVSVGTESQELEIQLSPSSSKLNQVVVIGYGTQEKTTNTSAISSIDTKTLNAIPTVDVQQAMQGRIPGLQVTENGSPGTSPLVSIRGISSISFASNPLYVVDGFPTGDLSTIDNSDIESVDVLKDASAAAIYGSRATNGVVMITTKKGTNDGKLHVNLNSYFGFQKVTKRLNLLNPSQFDKYALAYRGSLVPRRQSPWVDRPLFEGSKATYGNNITDWQDAYFRTGEMSHTNISLNGGNEVSTFYASAGHLKQKGTTPAVGYERYNFRINSNHKISKVFNFGENIYFAYGDQNYDNNETQARSNLLNVIRMMPYMPVHDPTTDGGYRGVNSVLDGGDPTNPIEDAELKNRGSRKTIKFLGTAHVEVKFTDWLKFRSTFGLDYSNGLDYRFSPIFNDSGTVNGSNAVIASLVNNRSISVTKLFTEQLSFEKTFGNHHVKAIAVYEYQGQSIKNENMSGNQSSNKIRVLNNATNIAANTLRSDLNILSYVGRFNYDYKRKYLLTASVRRDGGSYWAQGHKWETFPSVSVGWRLDQEEFLKNNQFISELKITGGYGITGLNGAVLGATPWLASVDAKSTFYPFNNDLTGGPASSIQSLGNDNLEWEKTKQVNIGLNLGLLNNKVTLVANYYHRETNNLILEVPLSPSMGFLNSSVIENAGAMRNNGFEFQVSYNEQKNNFGWGATGNFSLISNKVLKLAEGISGIEAGSDPDFTEGYNVTNTVPGHPVQSFYGWDEVGIFQNKSEVNKAPYQSDATAPGDIRFRDLDGNDTIDLRDREFLGSFIPKFTYSLNLHFNYKRIDLSVFFQGVNGNKIYNATRTATEGMIRFFNAGTKVLDAWTPENTNTEVPRAVNSDPNDNARPSTRFLEDGSFLRMKNIRLNYTLSKSSLETFLGGAIKDLSIYFSATNLFTFTNYSGFDPEVGNRAPSSSSLTNGIDYAVYPQPKGFQVGLNVKF